MPVDLLLEILEIHFLRVLAQPRAAKLVFRLMALPTAGEIHVEPLSDRGGRRRLTPVPLTGSGGCWKCLEVRVDISKSLIRLLPLGKHRHHAPRLAHGFLELRPRQAPAGEVGTKCPFALRSMTIDAAAPFRRTPLEIALRSLLGVEKD